MAVSPTSIRVGRSRRASFFKKAVTADLSFGVFPTRWRETWPQTQIRAFGYGSFASRAPCRRPLVPPACTTD